MGAIPKSESSQINVPTSFASVPACPLEPEWGADLSTTVL